MEFLQHLWLPIVVCAVAVFMCSFLVWAILPHHKDDWAKLPNEEAVRDDLKARGIAPGVYVFPKMDNKSCNTPEGKASWERAPSGVLTVFTKPSMPKNMICTFLVFLIASVLIGYVAWHTLPGHAGSFGDRFQVVGTIGILTYCFSFLPNMIWFQASKRAMVNCLVDGVLYGVVTGATFSWLWPVAEPVLKL
ncbi:MAG: hypothetical protein Q8L55_09760 [Phycisphaerales bacterium]|nr:hypothetical protein [Phycisphaerales bacterium]